MNSSSSRHYYLFKGDWYEIFIDLLDIAQADQQKFLIWEPQNKTKEHNLIVLVGGALSEEYCLKKRIWKTDEDVFDTFYWNKIDKFNMHGNYNPLPETEVTDESFLENQFSDN
jgi:hypothetical protein